MLGCLSNFLIYGNHSDCFCFGATIFYVTAAQCCEVSSISNFWDRFVFQVFYSYGIGFFMILAFEIFSGQIFAAFPFCIDVSDRSRRQSCTSTLYSAVYEYHNVPVHCNYINGYNRFSFCSSILWKRTATLFSSHFPDISGSTLF